MKETIELSPSILDYLNQEPEERKYWRAGFQRNVFASGNGYSVAYTCENAAWKAREQFARRADYRLVTDAPVQETRQEVIERARCAGAHAVAVLDEQNQLIEEWTV